MVAEEITVPVSERELVLQREMKATPEQLFRGWTDPELMKQWFAPKPYTVPIAETDVRPGGKSFIVMGAPDGTEIPCRGVYLEVIPNKKIVFTDAFTEAWEPSAKPFMTATVTFEDLGNGKTLYTATAKHWTVEDRKTHEQMGFHQGWGICAQQLEDLFSR